MDLQGSFTNPIYCHIHAYTCLDAYKWVWLCRCLAFARPSQQHHLLPHSCVHVPRSIQMHSILQMPCIRKASENPSHTPHILQHPCIHMPKGIRQRHDSILFCRCLACERHWKPLSPTPSTTTCIHVPRSIQMHSILQMPSNRTAFETPSHKPHLLLLCCHIHAYTRLEKKRMHSILQILCSCKAFTRPSHKPHLLPRLYIHTSWSLQMSWILQIFDAKAASRENWCTLLL